MEGPLKTDAVMSLNSSTSPDSSTNHGSWESGYPQFRDPKTCSTRNQKKPLDISYKNCRKKEQVLLKSDNPQKYTILSIITESPPKNKFKMSAEHFGPISREFSLETTRSMHKQESKRSEVEIAT